MTTVADAKDIILTCFKTKWEADVSTTGIILVYPGKTFEPEPEITHLKIVWNPTFDEVFTMGEDSQTRQRLVAGTVIFQLHYWLDGVSDTVAAEDLGELIRSILQAQNLDMGIRVEANSPIVLNREQGYWRVNVTVPWRFRTPTT